MHLFRDSLVHMYVIDISYLKGSHGVQEIDFLIKTESYIIYGF